MSRRLDIIEAQTKHKHSIDSYPHFACRRRSEKLQNQIRDEHELTIFIRWTVWTRIAVIFYFAAFVLLLSAPKALLLFGLIDLLSAIWTLFALKRDIVP